LSLWLAGLPDVCIADAMRVKLGKRLFVFLAVVALVGGPWAQALAQAAPQPCPMSSVAGATTVAAAQTAPCDMPSHKADDGKMMAVCAQDCLAQLNLVLPAIDLCLEGVARIFAPAVRLALDGHPPDPELSPPIALI
jgi:hypothetical protein